MPNFHLRLRTIVLCTMLFSSAFGADATAKTARHFEIPDWFSSSFLELDADAKDAADAGKHLMLFFHLDGCIYCAQMLDENFRQNPSKDRIQREFDVIDINIKGSRSVEFSGFAAMEERELATRLGIKATPSIFFLDGQSKVQLRIDGYRSPEDFSKILNFITSKAYNSSSFEGYLAAL